MPTNPNATTQFNTSTIFVGGGQTATIDVGQLVNDGQVFVRGDLTVASQLTGIGSLSVGGGGTVELGQIVGSGQSVRLNAGVLQLDDPHEFLATITNWGTNAVLALPHLTLTGASVAGGVLTLSDGSFTEAQIRLSGGVAAEHFQVTNGSDGTALVAVVH